MSGLVLIVGALLLATGGYEMLAGSGDILSERGWSAFIAGSALVAGGVVTMALGIVVRGVERLRGAILQSQPAPDTIAVLAEQNGSGPSAAAPIPVVPPAAQPDLFHEPTSEKAPVLAASPIELDHVSDPHPEATPAIPAPTSVEPEPEPSPAPSAQERSELEHDDLLDHSFADLEREMAIRHEPVPTPTQPEPVAAADTEPAAIPEPPLARALAPYVPSLVHEEPSVSPQAAAADLATISAREETMPTASPVIGRYESEGTSYVMYADGSIDAQSEAGVYRFSSMAELKSFIES